MFNVSIYSINRKYRKVAVAKNASDIHIEPQEDNGYKIRLRIDGRLRELKQNDLLNPEHGKYFLGQ